MVVVPIAIASANGPVAARPKQGKAARQIKVLQADGNAGEGRR
jgi:hypothetical protein